MLGQRKMTHDYRAQLSTLSELLEGGELEDAKAYLSEMKARQSERILLINTHNAAIDAVLNQKGYAGQRQGIDMRFRVNDLSALKLPRVDVTIVLANLIDNAMEACVQMPEAETLGQRPKSCTVMRCCRFPIINPSRPVQITARSNRLDKAGPSAARVWACATWRISWKSTTLNTPSRSRMPDLFLLLTGQIQITKATNPCC